MLRKGKGMGGGTVCSLDHLKLNIKCVCSALENIISSSSRASTWCIYTSVCSMVLLNAIRREHKQLLGKIKLVFIWLEMPTHTHSNWKRHNKHPARVPYCSFFGIPAFENVCFYRRFCLPMMGAPPEMMRKHFNECVIIIYSIWCAVAVRWWRNDTNLWMRRALDGHFIFLWVCVCVLYHLVDSFEKEKKTLGMMD